ncbi:NUDIX hydrolase [bacterium]|nr:NUDIX hydrolase [bacterium]
MKKFLLAVWKRLIRVPGAQTLMLRVLSTSFLVGASAVILDGEGRVLLFHHTYRDRFAWGLPGGWMRRGEQAPRALVREIAEESSLAVEIVAPLGADTVRRAAIIEIVYLARLTGGEFVASEEVDEMRWFSDELPSIKPVQSRAIAEARRLLAAGRLPERIDV